MVDHNELEPDRDAARELLQGIAERHGTSSGDFKIRCGSREWIVDRIIISVHSKVFAAACTSEFKEGQEAIYDLSEHPVDAVETLVFYMYNLNYDDRFRDAQQHSYLVFNIDICILADKYDLQTLKCLAKEKFIDGLGDFELDSTSNVTGDDTDPGVLAEAAIHAYGTPGPTQEIQTEIVSTVVGNSDLAWDPEMEKAIGKCAGFAADVALAFRDVYEFQRVPIDRAGLCRSCGQSRTPGRGRVSETRDE